MSLVVPGRVLWPRGWWLVIPRLSGFEKEVERRRRAAGGPHTERMPVACVAWGHMAGSFGQAVLGDDPGYDLARVGGSNGGGMWLHPDGWWRPWPVGMGKR